MTQNDGSLPPDHPPAPPPMRPPMTPAPPIPPAPPVRPTPPTLAYRTPRDEPRRNSPGQFILRALGGIGIGIASLVAGAFTASSSGIPGTFFVPIGIALVAAIVYSVRSRRFGYTTGIIVAPILLVGLAALLLFMICGGLKV